MTFDVERPTEVGDPGTMAMQVCVALMHCGERRGAPDTSVAVDITMYTVRLQMALAAAPLSAPFHWARVTPVTFCRTVVVVAKTVIRGSVGEGVGTPGANEGRKVGRDEGAGVVATVGCGEGTSVRAVGTAEGSGEGTVEGIGMGATDGRAEGRGEGKTVGGLEGSPGPVVGVAVGLTVGCVGAIVGGYVMNCSPAPDTMVVPEHAVAPRHPSLIIY
jgi:hypothetical protein